MKKWLESLLVVGRGDAEASWQDGKHCASTTKHFHPFLKLQQWPTLLTFWNRNFTF